MPDTFLSKLIVLFITELILRWKYVFFFSNDMMPPITKSNVFYFLEDKYNQFLLHVMPDTFGPSVRRSSSHGSGGRLLATK